MPRIALLANPESGGGEAGEVAEMLSRRGAKVTTLEIGQHEKAVGLQPDRIAVAGGDGSIGCAADVARRIAAPLAVIPVGTANDFARSLGLPRDADAAADLAVRGTVTRAVDLGHADGRPFVNAASAGLSPIAAHEAHGLKRAFGTFAYALGAVRAAFTAQPVACRVRCDGEESFAGRAWQVTVGVTGAFGGGAELDADPTDGVLDVAVIEAGPRSRLAVHAYGMRTGRLERQERVRTRAGRAVDLELTEGNGFNIDGELVEGTALKLSVEPRAFAVVVP
ncbi:MAG TPA: diacylglycerol kinase family protein [Solirubrobacterales bacterium]|nr:diacylglycerol kinase family protein [Solirubrobacterales bacterium]